MKKVLGIIILSILFSPVIAQRIVPNLIFKDIDDYNITRTSITKYQFNTIECYWGNVHEFNKDSCVHYSHEYFDSCGNLFELVKGDNLDSNKVDYSVQYKKISDTLYETLVKYPPGSTMIPDTIYTDTTINKKYRRWCLYKKDRNNNIVMRSVYYTKNEPEIKIERYDLDNKLVQIYYPTGIPTKPQTEWADSTFTEYGKTVTQNKTSTTGSYYREVDIYNKKNQLMEHSDWNKNSWGTKDLVRAIVIYDTAGNLIIRNTIDEDNRLISEEHYYYNKSKILIRYVRNDGFTNIEINEEKIFNDVGKITLYRSKPYYLDTETVWKYFYDDNTGLLSREELYKNGKYKASRFFFYKQI